MKNSLRIFDLKQRIFIVKCFYQGFGDYDCVKRNFLSAFGAAYDSLPTDEIVNEVIRLFEETGSVLKISDISEDFLELEVSRLVGGGREKFITCRKNMFTISLLLLQDNEQQIDLIYFKAHPDNPKLAENGNGSQDEVEEIEFDENLFDIPSSVVSSHDSTADSPGYDHQSFMTLFDYHQNSSSVDNSDISDTIREAVEKTLEDLEDPTKSLEASLSPLTSLDTPIASLEETIRELEESLRSIQREKSASTAENNHSSDSQKENRVKLKKTPSKRHQDKKIICEVCGKGFANNSRLENHKICHRDGKPHECSQCGKTFKWTFAYSRHMKIHFDTGAKTFKCHICGKSYRFERYLKVRIQMQFTEAFFFINLLLQLHEKNVHEKQMKYPCKWCKQEFFSQAELLVHWKTHNQGVFFSNTHTNISKIVSDLQCMECGRIFSSRDSLKKHMMIHAGHLPFTCDICGKGFTWKEGVRRHLFKHLGISDDLSPMCQICGKKVSRETTLKDHLKIHLRTEHEFKCHFQGCGKSFTTEKFLNRHINDRHSSRRYKCDNCETVYKDKSQLQVKKSSSFYVSAILLNFIMHFFLNYRFTSAGFI